MLLAKPSSCKFLKLIHDVGTDHVNHQLSNLRVPRFVKLANHVGNNHQIGLIGIENVVNVLFIVYKLDGMLVRLFVHKYTVASLVLLIPTGIAQVRLQDSHLSHTNLVNIHRSGRGQTHGLFTKSI